MAKEAHRRRGTALILELCLGDRAPFRLIDFFTGALEGEHEGAAQSWSSP